MIECPQCHNEIPPADFNVAADRAWCAKCKKVYRFSEISEATLTPPEFDKPVDWTDLPKWAKIEPLESGRGARLTLARRSKIWLFLIPFTAMWSGLSMFAMVSSLIKDGFQVQTLFFLPFFLGTLLLLAAILFSLAGYSTVEYDDQEVRIFSGVCGIGKHWLIPLESLQICRVQNPISGGRGGNFGYVKFIDKAGNDTKAILTMNEVMLVIAAKFVQNGIREYQEAHRV